MMMIYWLTSRFADYWHKLFWAKLKHIGLKPTPGSNVLDCCSGRGYLGHVFEFAFGTRTVYCDLSQLQLHDLIKTRRKDSEALPLAACAANISQLPYLGESFDYVVGNSFLHHISDVPAVLSETAPCHKA